MKNLMINISGGAIKLVALLHAFKQLLAKDQRDVHYHTITGVSAGAIIAFCFMAHKLDELSAMADKSYNRRLIFSWWSDPIGPRGGISLSAILRTIFGYSYWGKYDNLEKNLRKIVTESHWNMIKNHCSTLVYVMMVSEIDGKQRLVKLNGLTYEKAIAAVMASSTIAPMIKSHKYEGEPMMDGGHRGHSAGAFTLRTYQNLYSKVLNEVVSIYSRPSIMSYDAARLPRPRNFMQRLVNVTDVFVREVSINDELVEEYEASFSGIDYNAIHIPFFVSDTFAITKDQIEKGKLLGINAANHYLASIK
jgi:predicted patatin/cPLA2 family phospholipase